MKIYTKTGDNLTTDTIRNRVDKDHIIIEANGTIDELMASLMVSYHHNDDERIKEIIQIVVSDLFKICADIVLEGNNFLGEKVDGIENFIDDLTSTLPPLNEFVIPGKTLASSFLHLSRTICRRAERRVVSLAKEVELNPNVLKYMNRLSDLLFIMARVSEGGD